MENKAKKKNTQTEVLNTNDQSRNAQKEGKHMENNAQKQDTLTEVLKGQKLKPTIDLFRKLLEDAFANDLRLNVMTGRPEYLDRPSKTWREWGDVQEAGMREWFQTNYGLYREKMLRDAVQLQFEKHQVNPLTDLLDSLVWDGKPRISSFLCDILGCEDTPYFREVSRLIFAGGIHRAYRPGCKFDEMVVLVGRQGCGKSTIVRWLNLDDVFFREIKSIMGKDSLESLRGVWIAAMSELMAMSRSRDAEAVKAFITTQEDSYRAPYDHFALTIPRRCTFIGTTNHPQFLFDRTGNRRFYPVSVQCDGYDLLSREKELRAYIAQCWAEALSLFRKDQLLPFADQSVLCSIREQQEAAMEDDWRVGAISDYLDRRKEPNADVSVIELWHRALREPEESKPRHRDSIEIGQILCSLDGWRRTSRIATTPWGRQKVYEKEKAR